MQPALVVLDVAVLIVFIDHIAKSIQLPQVIASIAGDLSRAIDADVGTPVSGPRKAGPSLSEVIVRLDEESGVVRAPGSGYLQFVRVDSLIEIALRSRAVIRLLHRPGHFVVRASPWLTSGRPTQRPVSHERSAARMGRVRTGLSPRISPSRSISSWR